ncbi:MAG: S8 family serine peptidase, partial [Myxococcota bacterium]
MLGEQSLSTSPLSHVSVQGHSTTAQDEGRGSQGRDILQGAVKVAEKPEWKAPVASQKTLTRQNERGTFEIMADELLVSTRADATREEVEQLAASLGSQVLAQGKFSGIYRLSRPEKMELNTFMDALRTRELVTQAHYNAVAEATAASSSFQYSGLQWDRARLDLADGMIQPSDLHTIVVAVLDTGVAYEDYTSGSTTYVKASALDGVGLVQGYDFVNEDSHPNDDHQHGTHIANIIGSKRDTQGSASGVQLMPVKVLASNKRGTELDLIEGIRFATLNGADVINMSLSFGLGYFPSAGMDDAVGLASDAGVVMLGSAGNSGSLGIGFPGAFSDVISVGATRMLKWLDGKIYDVRASYSNAGDGIEIMAPGGDLTRDANLDGFPDGILAQTIKLNNPSQLSYVFYAGTSQSTAHASAAAAWLLASGVAPRNVLAYMTASAKSMASTMYNPLVGAGLIQVEDSLTYAQTHTSLKQPEYYINAVPKLTVYDGKIRAEVRLHVLDQNARPAANVRLAGYWYGSVRGYTSPVVTDANGVAYAISPATTNSGGIVIGYQVNSVANTNSNVLGRAFGYYALNPTDAEVLTRLLQDTTTAHSTLLFKLEPSSVTVANLMSVSNMVTTYVMKSTGEGLRAGPLVIAMNGKYLNDLWNAPSNAVQTLNYTFPSSLECGTGMCSGATVKRYAVSSSKLGSATSHLIMNFDGTMGQVLRGYSIPIVNGYNLAFVPHNQNYLNTFFSTAIADGFASSSLGDGFASSSLGDGFASSSLGDGFASSSLGDGFAS